MTLEGANKTMKRRGKSVQREVSILERLQNIRAMLIEVRESLGEDGGVEYEAPIDAVSELITDVEAEAKQGVVAAATTQGDDAADAAAAAAAAAAEEAAADSAPRRRGRPRKVVEEAGEVEQPGVMRRRGRAKKGDENKELFPFYEQSLF